MNWKVQLKRYEQQKDWDSAIKLMQKYIKDNNQDLDAYLCMNYLLMNLLVEEDYDVKKQDYYAELLKKYFLESFSKFSHNPDYLFYTGITAHLSEWYFDIDIEAAKTMLKDAFFLEPRNIIYEWGYYYYVEVNDESSKLKVVNCSKEILNNNTLQESLTSKGALGEYILEIMQYSSKS